ncbi:c-type cytochrome [Oceanicola sp. S124]|uniref:c-type cytochrome n=1 Tax=Oceanicola sp. S124 TaxID=1042378 RepID=UPI000255A6FB|nr:cytochrome c [Oceanicola sp. S124]
MKRYILYALGLAALGAITYLAIPTQTDTATAAPAEGGPIVEVTLPKTLSDTAQMGERAFNSVCADCHGENAAGKMGFGPPLIHKIYEPSHHGDMAFTLAAAQGVRAHHWRFGDMPAQPGVTPAEVQTIIAYVREVQRANGIQ